MALRSGLRDKEPTSSVFGLEEAMAKLSMELMKPEEEKLMTVSDITPEEVFGLATLMSYAELFKSKLIERWIENFLMLRISRFRTGRKELLMLGSGLREGGERKKRASLDSFFAGLK